jgi:hypothetical protein
MQTADRIEKPSWWSACCLALIAVYAPFFIAAITTWLRTDSSTACKAIWLEYLWVAPGIILAPFACLPIYRIFGEPISSRAVLYLIAGLLSVIVVGITAWLVRKGRNVRRASLVGITILFSLDAIVMWFTFNGVLPPPHHFQDVDHIPVDARMEGWAGPLNHIAVDHVYYYSTRMLFCSQYFRCHIVHQDDFDRFRESIRSQAPPGKQARENGIAASELGAESREYKIIRPWWDWPSRSDCEVFCMANNYVVVFDRVGGVVYIARGDN